jgi:hypothetical protein
MRDATVNQTRLGGSRGAAWAWNFLVHPAIFFCGRLQQKPNWPLALTAPALCMVLQFVSGLMFSSKAQPIVQEFLAREHLQQTDMRMFGVLASIFAGASWAATCGTMIAAVVCFDVLFEDSGRLKRLAEFTALSFFAQLPFCVLIIVVAWFWSPEPIGLALDSSPGELAATIQQWKGEMFGWWPLAASRVIGYYALTWQVVLIGIFLKVVSRLKLWAVLFACAFILGLFVLIQLASR